MAGKQRAAVFDACSALEHADRQIPDDGQHGDGNTEWHENGVADSEVLTSNAGKYQHRAQTAEHALPGFGPD